MIFCQYSKAADLMRQGRRPYSGRIFCPPSLWGRGASGGPARSPDLPPEELAQVAGQGAALLPGQAGRLLLFLPGDRHGDGTFPLLHGDPSMYLYNIR